MLVEEMGRDRLVKELGSRRRAELALMREALSKLGITSATVGGHFPLGLARELEAADVHLEVDDEFFIAARRRKSVVELEGIRRSTRAADSAIEAIRRILSSADITSGGRVFVDGTPLTVERLKQVVYGILAEMDTTLEGFILSRGEQTAIGHDFGSGELRQSEPIVIDLWPRDRSSGCYTDITRTLVVGEPPAKLHEFHELCSQALQLVLDRLRPGAASTELHELVCRFFEDHGYRTPLSTKDGEVLEEGFPYALGHGVGLELHEPPVLRSGEDSTLIAGDVLAIEPGLYERGFGGCRIEDVFLVTESGWESLSSSSYDLEVK